MDLSIDDVELRQHYEDEGWFRARPSGKKLYRSDLYRTLIDGWVRSELPCLIIRALSGRHTQV